MSLSEYFKSVYNTVDRNWNVDSALTDFGDLTETIDESMGFMRYVVSPFDKRFSEIFLNFNTDSNIESIVWFFNSSQSESLTLNELKILFGPFEIKNITYDDTTEFIFFPRENPSIRYVSTPILHWVQTRKNGTLYYKDINQEIEVNENYKLSSLSFVLI